MLDVRDGFANRDVFDAGEADDIPGGRLGDVDTAKALEGKQLRDSCLLDAAIELADRDRIADLDPAVEDAPDRNTPQVVARIEVGHEHLERSLAVPARWRHTVHDGIEQRAQILTAVVRRQARRAGPRAGVEHREINLLLGRIQVDEEVVHLVQHFLRTRVGAVDLVDHDDWRQTPFEGFPENEARLGQGTFRGVDQQQDAVDHREGALDLATEVRVSGRIDDIDEEIPVMNRRVLRQDCDATLALEVGVVHRAFGDPLVGSKNTALVKHGVDQGRFPMVDVGDDGDVAPQRVGDGRSALCGRGHLTSITEVRYAVVRRSWLVARSPLRFARYSCESYEQRATNHELRLRCP